MQRLDWNRSRCIQNLYQISLLAVYSFHQVVYVPGKGVQADDVEEELIIGIAPLRARWSVHGDDSGVELRSTDKNGTVLRMTELP